MKPENTENKEKMALERNCAEPQSARKKRATRKMRNLNISKRRLKKMEKEKLFGITWLDYKDVFFCSVCYRCCSTIHIQKTMFYDNERQQERHLFRVEKKLRNARKSQKGSLDQIVEIVELFRVVDFPIEEILKAETVLDIEKHQQEESSSENRDPNKSLDVAILAENVADLGLDDASSDLTDSESY